MGIPPGRIANVTPSVDAYHTGFTAPVGGEILTVDPGQKSPGSSMGQEGVSSIVTVIISISVPQVFVASIEMSNVWAELKDKQRSVPDGLVNGLPGTPGIVQIRSPGQLFQLAEAKVSKRDVRSR